MVHLSLCQNQKNTIDPEEIINNYGSDSVRLFIVSDSPPEKDIQWSEEGINGCYKFVQKLWTMHKNIIDKINSKDSDKSNNKSLETFTNQFVEKVTTNLEKFRYNVIIANFYEMYNFLSKEINKPLNISSLKEIYVKILKLYSLPLFLKYYFLGLKPLFFYH